MKSKKRVLITVGIVLLIVLIGFISYNILTDKDNEIYRCRYCEMSLKKK